MLNELGITEKTIDQLINLGLSIVILAVGWIVIKFIIRIARKALDRTSLDPVLYRFILKILRCGSFWLSPLWNGSVSK